MRVIHPAVAGVGLAVLLGLSGCTGAVASSGERIDGGTIVYAHQQEPFCVFGGWIEQAYLSYQVLDNRQASRTCSSRTTSASSAT